MIKSESEMLRKLGIEALNTMQKEATAAIGSGKDVILLSPTGTGKTLAFLLPIISKLSASTDGVQAMIVVPSRELAIQIEQVFREMGTGFKCNAVYGGQSFNQDKLNLKHPPSILIGTPGRIADHLRRSTFSTETIQTLILDEFDKSLEIGFENEMSQICSNLKTVSQRILTSATRIAEPPVFVALTQPVTVDFSSEMSDSQLQLRSIISPSKDKIHTLLEALKHLGNQPGIVFCNFKDSIMRVSEFLDDHDIPHGCFYGGMEQMDRERALIKFRNGTHQLIVATDLAARGLDIPEIRFILHYHLPLKAHEFVHRNGRTARMKSDGTAYVLLYENEIAPDYLPTLETQSTEFQPPITETKWKTIFISGGRRDKISKGDIAGLCFKPSLLETQTSNISKGDIAGLCFKQGGLEKDELGLIELKQDCAFVAVSKQKALELIQKIDGYRVKKRKVRVYGI